MTETIQQSAADVLQAGQVALMQGDWATARAAFEAALHQAETAEALEGLGLAAWWLEDATTASAARERAYQLYLAHDDRRGAARMALWQALDYLHYRHEVAVANGWLQRARQLLEGMAPTLEHGWLAIFAGHAALWFDHDPTTTRHLAAAAADLGRTLGVTDLEMLGVALEGLALVSTGQIAEGMRCLDAATTAVVAGEMTDLAAAGWTCCYLIYGCERARDYERAEQWCRMVQVWCQRWSARQLFAFCRTHYATVLIWQGAWSAAEAELLAVTHDRAADGSRVPEAAPAAGALGGNHCAARSGGIPFAGRPHARRAGSRSRGCRDCRGSGRSLPAPDSPRESGGARRRAGTPRAYTAGSGR